MAPNTIPIVEILLQSAAKTFPNKTSWISESPCGVLEIKRTVSADAKAYNIPMMASCFNLLSRILMKDISNAPASVNIKGMEVSPVPINAAKATPNEDICPNARSTNTIPLPTTCTPR
jgi:hypothetical protein